MPKSRKLVPLEYSIDPFLTKAIFLLILSLLARGILHFTQMPPYLALLQDEGIVKPWIELCGISWTWYVQSSSIEQFLYLLGLGMGGVFLVSVIFISIFPQYLSHILKRKKNVQNQNTQFKQRVSQRRLTEPPAVLSYIRLYLWFIFMVQLLYTLCLYCEHSFYLISFLEQAIQYLLPVVVYLLLPYQQIKWVHWSQVARYALSAVFIGHGLVAINYYDMPDDYLIMFMNALHVSEDTAFLILKGVGILDIIVAVGIHLNADIALKPLGDVDDLYGMRDVTQQKVSSTKNDLPDIYHYRWWKKGVILLQKLYDQVKNTWVQHKDHMRMISLRYMLFWGVCTACARIIGHLNEDRMNILYSWVPECIVRLPHGLLAYLLIKYYQQINSEVHA